MGEETLPAVEGGCCCPAAVPGCGDRVEGDATVSPDMLSERVVLDAFRPRLFGPAVAGSDLLPKILAKDASEGDGRAEVGDA